MNSKGHSPIRASKLVDTIIGSMSIIGLRGRSPVAYDYSTLRFKRFRDIILHRIRPAQHRRRRLAYSTARTVLSNVVTRRKTTIIIVVQYGATPLSFALSPKTLITAMMGKKNTHGGRCVEIIPPRR